MTRAHLAFFTCLLIAACSSTHAEDADRRFVGTFTGRATRDRVNAAGHSLVERLEVSLEAGTYRITATMNDTNREEGMDHTSNTYWHWSAEAPSDGDVLRFTYHARFAGEIMQDGRGSFRRARGTYILKIDDIEYTLRRSPNI